MKKVVMLGTVVVILICWMTFNNSGIAATERGVVFEYSTLRWDGKDNTHVIRADGKVEFLGSKFAGIKKPERTDERSFFMNLAMNALARDGYELVAMTPDDYVFRRTVTR